MMFIEGRGGPGMLSRRVGGDWCIDANTGASVVFTNSRPTREELAIAYFWHACDELTARPSFTRRMGESSVVVDRVDEREFDEFARRLNLSR
ncbi:MAG: hypothetical protein Q8O67_32580 [Deltaproteobacteria bacterium]|nr:hypothetical protein [Deltaproteobacteria bacterium]